MRGELLQRVGQIRLQDEMRIISIFGFGASYIRDFTVLFFPRCEVLCCIASFYNKTTHSDIWAKLLDMCHGHQFLLSQFVRRSIVSYQRKGNTYVVHYRNILQSISIWCVIWEIHICGSACKLRLFFFLFRKQLVVTLHFWEDANYWNQGRKLFSFFNSLKKNISRWWCTRRQIIVTGARDHLQTKCTVGVWSNFIPHDMIDVITYPCWY